MSIGFRLTTKCKSISSFQKLLDVVAARHEASVSHSASNWSRVRTS